jgi:hypothetical protein
MNGPEQRIGRACKGRATGEKALGDARNRLERFDRITRDDLEDIRKETQASAGVVGITVRSRRTLNGPRGPAPFSGMPGRDGRIRAMKILVLHGINLNMFGKRDASQYGTATLAEIDNRLQELAGELGVEISASRRISRARWSSASTGRMRRQSTASSSTPAHGRTTATASAMRSRS